MGRGPAGSRGEVPFLPAPSCSNGNDGRSNSLAQSVLSGAEAGLSPVGLEYLFETLARAAVFISESPLPTASG